MWRVGRAAQKLLSTAKFCSECGTAVSNGSKAAEYKQATVLFADVVRSMDIAAAVDIERLREIMVELVERSAVVARRYGGTVEYNGDGVMALFGAPVALRRPRFAGVSGRVGHPRGGRTVGGRGGPPRRRGAAAAGGPGFGPGDRRTHRPGVCRDRRARRDGPAHGIGGTPRGGDALGRDRAAGRGHGCPVRTGVGAHQKSRPAGARAPAAGNQRAGEPSRQAEASLVGRRWEIAALNALVERTIRGRGGVVTVMGPPRIGKSRMAREAAALAAGQGVEVFWAFCESHARDISFGTVARLLRAGSGVAGLDGEASVPR
jgi:class 3 adenylate cyclase